MRQIFGEKRQRRGPADQQVSPRKTSSTHVGPRTLDRLHHGGQPGRVSSDGNYQVDGREAGEYACRRLAFGGNYLDFESRVHGCGA